MVAAKQAKTERLDVRLSRRHKVLIEEAAALVGQPVTAFAVSTLVKRAEELVRRHEVTVLSARDQMAFLKILDNAEPSDQLRRAARRFRTRNA